MSASPDSRRWWALGALNLAVLAASLDGTVLVVALPTLARKLHASESDLQWFSSAYLLMLAATMLPAGLLGDRYGRKKVLVGALALFGAASVACAVSPSSEVFIGARALVGMAGAAVIVMVLSTLTVLFSEEERPKAVGVWAAANFVALPLGPVLGGWLLSHYWWGLVFLINVPVVVVGLLATVALVPESRAPRRPGLDPIGMTVSVAGLVALTYGLIEAGQHNWIYPTAVAPIVAGVICLVSLFAWERWLSRQQGGAPLLDLTLFRSRSYTWGVILSAVGVLAMMGVLFTLPQYFQGVVGTDAMGSGLRLLPLVGGLVVSAPAAGRLAHAIGANRVVALGFAVLVGGLCAGAMTTAGSGEAFLAAWTAVLGVGMGLVMATTTSAALSELPEERSGVGSAVLQALNKTGGPLGSAVLGSTLSVVYLAHVSAALTSLPAAAARSVRQSIFGATAVAQRIHSIALVHVARAAFADGLDAALLVSAGIAAVGAVLAMVFLPRGRTIVADARPPEARPPARKEPVAVPHHLLDG